MAAEPGGRRQFLIGISSLFAGGVAANDRISVAFIGAGPGSLRNAAYAARTPGIAIAGVRAGRDFRDILADPSIDAVCIDTGDHRHARLTVEACQAGKDVWVETPACMSVEEGARMVEAARKYRRVVQAGTVERSRGLARKAREMVRRGELGEVRFCRGGWGVHPVDTLQFAFDEAMPVSVAAQSRPDSLLVTCRYPGFVACYTTYPGGYVTSLHGTEATLVLDRAGLRICRRGSRQVEERGREPAMRAAHWKDFADCVRTRRRPVSDIETCVRSTATCLLAGSGPQGLKTGG